ncbi:O-antigen ligase family protein [Patescibacteria group bacterium]|nr:O-antigen ligase family protein [Patescibacteria group bacterium]
MESVLSPEIPNVAKIVVDGERIIRAYGTFPHPNVFSGFLILSIFCGVWLLLSYKTLKIYKITSRMPFNALTAKKMADLKHNKQIVSRETILYIFLIIGIIAHLTAFILTFSRTSWLISILIFFIFTFLVIKSKLFYHPALKLRTTGACPSKHAYFLKKFFNLKQISTIVSRETICNERRRVKQFITFITRKTTIILIFSLIIALLLISCSNWKQIGNRANIVENTYQQSIDYRILYNDIAINIIKKYPLTGIGGKNFTLQMQEFTATPLEWWQFQPAHNIYLLVACELGIIGLALLLLFIFLVLKRQCLSNKNQIVSRETIWNRDRAVEIVSRETILQVADKRRTVLAQAKADEAISTGARQGEAIRDRDCNPEIVSRETISGSTVDSRLLLLQMGLTSILAGFLFIGLFDHYFWTLQQGQLVFWIVLGAIASIKR